MNDFENMARLLRSNIALEESNVQNRKHQEVVIQTANQEQISLLRNANYRSQQAINNWEQMLHQITYQKFTEDNQDEH